MSEVLIYGAPRSARFSKKLSEALGVQRGHAEIGEFPDSQPYIRLQTMPDAENIVVVGNTHGFVQTGQLLQLIRTVKRYKPKRSQLIVAVPYFGAGRQDRPKDGEDAQAKWDAEDVGRLRPDWIFFIDLHNAATRDFVSDRYGVSTRELYAESTFFESMQRLHLRNFVCVAPDVGRLNWVRSYAKRFGVEAASLDKRREGPGKVAVYHVIGDVKGKNVIMIDDIVDSGSTAKKAADALKNAGAGEIHFYGTHLVLNPSSIFLTAQVPSPFTSLFGTDTIDNTDRVHGFTVLSMVPVFAEHIAKILI